MKTKSIFLIPIFIAGFTACTHVPKEQPETPDNARYIDPFISTADDHGQTDVAAAIPFGMVKPCPDTYPPGHSGYDYSSKEITGFSQTRFSGVGCRGVGGNLRILPFSKSESVPGKLVYDKSSEIAKPGYYAVSLDGNVKVRLTATNNVAFHEYIFPESENSGISIDLTSSFVEHISEQHTMDESGIIYGKIQSVNVCKKGKYSFFYALTIDKKSVRTEDRDSKIIYRFNTREGEKINLWCALSAVSEEQAMATLKREMNVEFNEVKNEAYKKWNDLLNKVVVETENESSLRLFYTHLYHTTQSPFLISEPDGTYRGSDGRIYKNELKKYYHGWSVWDTFRSKLPLLSFLYPEKYKEMLASLGKLYEQGKPEWATDTEPFITIRTEHTIPILLDAYRKGLLPFPLEDIYPRLTEEAENLAFVSPDNVLESSYDLWALSEIASILGYEEDADIYFSKAMNYKPLWEEKFLHMNESSDIMHGDGLYEGTLWQYRWFVPFDMPGIIRLMGGKDIFEQQLDYFFDNELFNIGNQPDIQVPYLYAYTNSPWKTQKLVNSLLNEEINNWYGTHEKWDTPHTRKIFQDTPEGYIKEMDDDAGTMSAWYIWSAMGFYPVFPGSTNLVLSTPQFDKITIDFPEKDLEIITIRPTKNSIYIQNVEIDGETHNSAFIEFDRLIQGGKMIIELGETPDGNSVDSKISENPSPKEN